MVEEKKLKTNVKKATKPTGEKSLVVNKKKVVSKSVKSEKKAAEVKVSAGGQTKKVLKGVVVSCKMQKTVVVAIKRKVAHPVYGKLIKKTKRIKADLNGLDVKEGDMVFIEQTRPISKGKNFKVLRKEEAV